MSVRRKTTRAAWRAKNKERLKEYNRQYESGYTRKYKTDEAAKTVLYDRNKARRKKNREENNEEHQHNLAKHRQWHAENYDPEERAKYAAEYYEANKGRVRAKVLERQIQVKQAVVARYGGACQRCGETILEFLTLDHVNDDGAEHRKQIGRHAFAWAHKNGCPPVLQCLCFTCNLLKVPVTPDSPSNRSRRRLKELVLSKYGGVCTCCGDGRIRALTVDHIGGGGNVHRKEIGINGGTEFYRWLRNNEFPSGFRIMCWNCNESAHRGGGICAHKRLLN